jgi:hypothetical protein
MDSLTEKVAVGLAGTISRRDLISRTLRGVVGLGLGAACLFGAQRSAFAVDCFLWGGNTCGQGETACSDYSSTEGCGGYGFCGGTGCESGTTNCNPDGPVPQNYGYWDCCCQDDVLYRCRVCGTAGGGPQCVCHGAIGVC